MFYFVFISFYWQKEIKEILQIENISHITNMKESQRLHILNIFYSSIEHTLLKHFFFVSYKEHIKNLS